MPLVFDTSGSTDVEGLYTTIAAVRAMPGVSDAIDDDTIIAAIELGDAIIDSYVTDGFPEQITETRNFFDVRNWPLSLPRPFSSVTAVTVDGYALPTTAFNVTTYGVELNWGRLDSNIVSMLCPYPPFSVSHNSHGSNVTVAATWGWASIPAPVSLAATILAVSVLAGDSGVLGGIDVASLDQRITGISVEGFSLSLSDPASSSGNGGGTKRTTGNARVDRLLQRYRTDRVGIL